MYKIYLLIIFLTPSGPSCAHTRQNYQNKFPLHYAAFRGDDHAIKRLVDSGNHLINGPDLYGNSPIHLAAFANKQPSVEYLLILGAEAEVRNHRGLLPEDTSTNGACQFLKEYRELDLPIE